MDTKRQIERLDSLTRGMLFQRRRDQRSVEEAMSRMDRIEQATLEIASALREAGITVGEVGSPFGPAEVPAPPNADVSSAT